MMFSRDDVEASYGFCRSACRRAGSNFPLGFLLLPREKRRAMEALYAFMRHTDDLADDRSSDSAGVALAHWRTALHEAIAGDGGRGTGDGGCQCKMQNAKCKMPPSAILHPSSSIFPALADAVQRFHIPHEHLFAVIDGVEMDLGRQRFETFQELERYCERVASAVGLACIHIWGFRGPEAFEPARQAGVALQLTNILRDLKEDADLGRVYLPLAEMRRCDYSEEDLRAGVADEHFRRLMDEQIARAERFYAAGAELMDSLEPAGRRIFGLMTATYHALLRKIARDPAAVFQCHLRLGRLEKLRLAARWALLPPGKAGLR